MNVLNTLYEALFSYEVTSLSAIIKLLISFVLGMFIGIERQLRRQAAGIRTFALICTASTAAMLLSIWIPQSFPNMLNGDPGRIAAQILTGIGFLGAGAIIQSRGSIYGLTTAASIWMVAIIGMCVGANMYIPAVVLSALSLFALVWLNQVEHKRTLSGEAKQLVISFNTDSPDIEGIKKVLADHSIFIFNLSIDKDFKNQTATVYFRIHLNPVLTLDEVFDKIKTDSSVTKMSLRML